MKKNKYINKLVIISIIIFLFFTNIKDASSAPSCNQPNSFNEYICTDTPNCPNVNINYIPGGGGAGGIDAKDLTYNITVNQPNFKYRVHDEFAWDTNDYSEEFGPGVNKLEPIKSRSGQDILTFNGSSHDLFVEAWSDTRNDWINYCGPFPYEIKYITPTPKPSIPPSSTCGFNLSSDNIDPSLITPLDRVFIKNGIISPISGNPLPTVPKLSAWIYKYPFSPRRGLVGTEYSLTYITTNIITFDGYIGSLYENGQYNVIVAAETRGTYDTPVALCPIKSFWVSDSGIQLGTPTPIPSPTNPPICQACQRAFDPCADQRCKESCNFCATPIPSPTNFPPAPPLAPLCEQLPIDFVEKCKKCIDKPEDGGQGGIWTAVGCIPINPEIFIRDFIFKIGVGIAGGVAFLYFIFGVFQILTSAGNAEKIAQAKEIIMSAISGLLLIIFSILLLKVIGVDILRIPGFS